MEVGGDRQLEDALLERRRIPLAETALPQRAALLLKGGIEIALGERALELFPRRAPGRARVTRAPAAPPGPDARARRAARGARPRSIPRA